MQATPLVSVIIPFYNEERFLEDTLKSVLRQTYPHWEIILIDDGSSDGSTALAKRYAADYPSKINYTEHEGHKNKGLSATRNHGISKARGILTALLDADDIWLPDKLQKQVSIFQEHPEVALLCESSLYWYTWDNPASHDVEIPVGVQPNRAYEPPHLSLLLYPLGTGAAPCPSGLMIRTETLRKLGGFEASFTGPNQMYEDQPFLTKFYLNEMVYVSSDCNNMYRQRHGSLVQAVKAKGQYHDVRHFFLQWLQRYIDTNHLHNSDVDALLEKALYRYKHPKLYKAVDFIKNTFSRSAHG